MGSEATMTDQNWEGAIYHDRHHTVGPNRARCMNCAEWCYPDEPCDCCMEGQGYVKTWVKGGDDG